MNISYAHDPTVFIDQFIRFNEKGKPWTLSRHQRRVLAVAFQWDGEGLLRIRTFLWGEMKKSGKTFIAACLVLWWAFITSNSEIIVAANALEQSMGRVFQTVVQLLEQNPTLGLSAKVRATDIKLTNGTTIKPIPSDYKSAAGSRHSLVVFDELWGYSLEAAQRLYEELTPPPTEDNAWLLIVTYAGWTGESVLLERLYKQGLAGERADEELELYRADELFMFWSHTPRQPWQTERYYAEQRRNLRQGTFDRIHRNVWVSAESAFITAEMYDACVDTLHRPLLPSKAIDLYIGIDGSTKRDTACVAAVRRLEGRLQLVCHRIWKPSPEQPLDLEATIEAYLRELYRDYAVRVGGADPFALHHTIMALQASGVPIQEFPQTVTNTTRMGQCLFDLIKSQNIVLYPDEELRLHALNAVAVEMPRGFRLAKEKASKKIDAAVALAIACCMAAGSPPHRPLELIESGWRGYTRADLEKLEQAEWEERREEGVAWLAEQVKTHDGCYFPGD